MSSTQMDEWELKLEDKLKEINACQMEKFQKTSCNPNNQYCEKFFECDLRRSYVLAVYESMNKGSGGGFEF